MYDSDVCPVTLLYYTGIHVILWFIQSSLRFRGFDWEDFEENTPFALKIGTYREYLDSFRAVISYPARYGEIKAKRQYDDEDIYNLEVWSWLCWFYCEVCEENDCIDSKNSTWLVHPDGISINGRTINCGYLQTFHRELLVANHAYNTFSETVVPLVDIDITYYRFGNSYGDITKDRDNRFVSLWEIVDQSDNVTTTPNVNLVKDVDLTYFFELYENVGFCRWYGIYCCRWALGTWRVANPYLWYYC